MPQPSAAAVLPPAGPPTSGRPSDSPQPSAVGPSNDTLPGLAERALATIPGIPGAGRLPLWAILVLGLGLVWLAVVVGSLASRTPPGRRRA